MRCTYSEKNSEFVKPVKLGYLYSCCWKCKCVNDWSLFWTLSCLFTDSGKTLSFFNYDYRRDFQTVTFEGSEIKKIFHGSFHKVRYWKLHAENGFVSGQMQSKWIRTHVNPTVKYYLNVLGFDSLRLIFTLRNWLFAVLHQITSL